MDHRIEASNQIANIAEKVTYGGAGMAAVLGFMDQHAASIGILIGFIGLLVQWYYRRKEYRLKELESRYRGVVLDDE